MQRPMPTLLAGGGAGTIKTGRQLKYENKTDLSKLHISLLQRLGLELNEFGTAENGLSELAG